MDFRTVVTISALLLMTAEADQTSNETETANETVRDSTNCTCPSASPAFTAAPTSKPAPVLHFLTVKWTGKCEGRLVLYTPSSTIPFCPENITSIQSLLPNVCEDKAGCKGSTNWKRSPDMEDGYHEEKTSCGTVRVQCKVEPAKVIPDVQGQLQAYKVVTALLCCMLLVLLLIRFTRPTVKALQKRLSDRRQNRWIGPTQSHSVSYHRGKTAVKQNDGEKRLSYPALERLAVSDSREPSSSRNSYNF